MKTLSRSLVLLLFQFLSLTRCLCCPAALAWVNRVQGGRISLLCLSMIRPASLMQSYYLHSTADRHWQGEAAVTYSVCGVVSGCFKLHPDHVCSSWCVYSTTVHVQASELTRCYCKTHCGCAALTHPSVSCPVCLHPANLWVNILHANRGKNGLNTEQQSLVLLFHNYCKPTASCLSVRWQSCPNQ